MRFSFLSIATLIAAINAFTITSPSAGQTIDPSQPITFSWTFNSTDPASFDIFLNQPGGATNNVQVASDVSTFTGSYIISTSSIGTIRNYGANFTLRAESMFTGAFLAQSGNFTLSMGNSTSSTYTGGVTAGPASGTNSVPSSARATGTASTTAAASSGAATSSNSFTTSTVRSSGSGTGTAASSAASATSSHNAQPRLGSKSQMAFTAAGLIAGLAALVA